MIVYHYLMFSQRTCTVVWNSSLKLKILYMIFPVNNRAATQCHFKIRYYHPFYCPPPFRRKAEGHSFRHSVLPSFRPPNIVGTLCAQLLQFYADSFKTLQMF